MNKMAAEIQEAIRDILLRDWDPLEVVLVRDEYDDYITPVYNILVGSRSEQELIEFLFSAEDDLGGVLSESPEQLRPVALKLLSIDVGV